jgi:hypothetical protein
MRIPEILFCIAVLVFLAALVYADSRWRKWIKARRQERGGAPQEQNGGRGGR